MDTSGQSIQKITTRPGVYLYYDRHGTVIYVGKAQNLRNRVRQYFARDDAVEPKTALLVSQIAAIKTIPTDSEFDALLLEANLIRRYLPKYNAISRDDKSPLFIAITFDEPLPHILFTRKRALDPKTQTVFGPFQSGRVARKLMQSVRHIIPYCTQKRRDGKPCFYTHLGLCNPCPSSIGDNRERARVYRQNLRRIAALLSGKGVRVRAELKKAMKSAADRMAFEEAGGYKRQLDALNLLLTKPFDYGAYPDYETRVNDLGVVLQITNLHRIECFDISNIHGKWATASLVVFTDGIPDTDQYRRFRIHAAGRPNDVGMMREAITRRLNHSEWPKPNLLIVDGGKPQVAAALSITQIPVIGLAKRFEEIVIPKNDGFAALRLKPSSPALHLVQHIRDEAHRFAKRYHTVLRSKYA